MTDGEPPSVMTAWLRRELGRIDLGIFAVMTWFALAGTGALVAACLCVPDRPGLLGESAVAVWFVAWSWMFVAIARVGRTVVVNRSPLALRIIGGVFAVQNAAVAMSAGTRDPAMVPILLLFAFLLSPPSWIYALLLRAMGKPVSRWFALFLVADAARVAWLLTRPG